MGLSMLVLKNWLLSAVNNSGAVSQVISAMDSRMTVNTKDLNARRVTLSDTCKRGAPTAKAASRKLVGTSFSMFSVVRTTTGIAINASDSDPAQPEKPPVVVTNSAYTNRPMTMDGADSMISVMKRVNDANLETHPNSTKKIPARMPIGVEISMEKSRIRPLPTMA